MLGKGGFGEVYEAMDISSNKKVAIKIEFPGKKQSLKLEIAVLKKCKSIHICSFVTSGLFKLGVDGQIYTYMVMDLLKQK